MKSVIWTALLTLFFLIFYLGPVPASEVVITLPFFIAFYYIFFSVGQEEIVSVMRLWINSDVRKAMIFPALLIVLYFFYVLLNKQNPFRGTLALVPYLIIFPVLVFAVRKGNIHKIDWFDFTAFVIYLLPTTFIKVIPEGSLPLNGDSLDSVYRIAFVLTAVYVFGTIRRLDDIGFYPVLNLKYLLRAIGVWLVFYLFVLTIGFNVDFIKYVGHEYIDKTLLNKIAITIIATFFHTAIFEELFFRGILQNMLSKRIGQSATWKIFWKWGLAILLPLALLVGYTLKGGIQWFPALMAGLIFAAAFFIERRGKNKSGVYTGLAITSVIFGLVHYHSGAIVYIGFACVAGWAYGYTYIRTKNVFYSALVHTLVNSSVLIFGLEFIK
jgi:membrane protease YdiL (CAAX protease family)